MNINFVEYDPITGRILMAGNVPEDMLFVQGRHLLAAAGSSETHYVDVVNNLLIEKTPRPSRFHKYDYTVFDWVPDTDYAWQWVRADRNRMLKESDWTQGTDAPIASREAWATYRQELRDITNQPDPLNIVWPEKPG